MSHADLEALIDKAFDDRDSINIDTTGDVRDGVNTALGLLDSGQARVAERRDGEWIVNQWLKKAVLLSFRLNDMAPIGGGPGGADWWDKVPSKFEGWGENR
jgi:2,3,4,5-tetrahydropyridine-2-carboxylate N-succinyltransferase